MTQLNNFIQELHLLADPAKAAILQRFFKTGKGEYGEGDKFLGITVPKQRSLIKNYLALDFADLGVLLQSLWHEERLAALLLLVKKYQKIQGGGIAGRQIFYDFYLSHIHAVNNWDLVDLSAPHIVGHHLFNTQQPEKNKKLFTLAQSSSLWQRRIAVVATQYFIRQNYYQDTLDLAQILLTDREVLIHKAAGWMLREIGKRNVAVLEEFLQRHYHHMPRTMLRYAIECLPEKQRQSYLRK